MGDVGIQVSLFGMSARGFGIGIILASQKQNKQKPKQNKKKTLKRSLASPVSRKSLLVPFLSVCSDAPGR